MRKHVLIAETYGKAAAKIKYGEWNPNDYIIITTDSREKLKGLELSPADFTVVDDARMPYSFFVDLQSRIRREA